MGIVFFDESGSTGSGTVYYPEIEGGIPIVAHQTIANDYLATITPPSNFRTYIVARWWTFIKILDFGQNYPFTSTPEVRYKLGTLVPVRGYEISSGGGGEQISPYYGEPDFLIYERTRTTDRVCQIITANPGYENYQAAFGNFSPINLNCIQQEVYVDTESYRGLESCMGLDINLTPGVIADIQLDYVFITQFISNSDTRTLVTIGL